MSFHQSECRLLFAATSYKTSDYVAMIDAVRSNVPALERVVFLGTDSWTNLLDAAEGDRRLVALKRA